MASYANAVIVGSTLTNSVPGDPSVGGGSSASLYYTDGDTSADANVMVETSSTTLHADIGGDGFVRVSNPSTVGGEANTVSVNLFAMAQALGPLPPGCSVTIPVSTGVQIKATVASGTLTVGVTVIECDFTLPS